jgi:hypothetical protein
VPIEKALHIFQLRKKRSIVESRAKLPHAIVLTRVLFDLPVGGR